MIDEEKRGPETNSDSEAFALETVAASLRQTRQNHIAKVWREWANDQRRLRAAGELPESIAQGLEAIPGWSWELEDEESR